MKTAAAYIRVSTDDQLEFSPDSQLRAIRDYAARHCLSLPGELVFMEEEGRSGRRASTRPQFLRMIAAAKTVPRPFDVIILWKFSRFARSREDSIVYKSMLRKQCGIEVVSVSEQLGDDKLSVLLEAMIEAMDEYYSINLGEEVRRGMTEKASRGQPVSIPAFGYRLREKRYEPDPDTAPLVAWIYREYLGGRGVGEIAADLNLRGVLTRRGSPITGRTVAYILRNPVYLGKIRWRPGGPDAPEPILADGTHRPLVDRESWEQAQELLRERRALRPGHGQDGAREVFLLRGLVLCSSCGGVLCRKTASSLQCHNYCAGKCGDSHSVTLKGMYAALLAALETDFPELFQGELRIPAPAAYLAGEEEPAARIRREEARLARAQAAYEAGIDSLEEYRDKKFRLTTSLSALQASPPRQGASAGGPASVRLADLLRGPSLGGEATNLLLHALFQGVIFDRRAGSIAICYRL